MNDQPKAETPDTLTPPKTQTPRGITLNPVSDMSEFEAKPRNPDPAVASDATPAVETTQVAQPPAYAPPLQQLSPKEQAAIDADIARRMPKMRVVERVPLLKLYLVLSVIFFAIPFIGFIAMASRIGLSAQNLQILGSAALMTVAPMILSILVTIFLIITKNARLATIVLTVMLVLGVVSFLLSVANGVLLASKGVEISGRFFGLLVSGLLLYFLYRVRQATSAADQHYISDSPLN